MTRDVASPKSTGGIGYQFEDGVIAWWCLHMLAGRSPIDPTLGPPTKIQLQARPDGWLLDDMVAEFSSSAGAVRAAVSVKSDRVVKRTGAPADFVEDCWNLHLSPGATGFNSGRDFLVLASGRLEVTVREAVNDGLALASAELDKLDARISVDDWTNEGVRTFVQSFGCPDALIQDGDKHPIGELLSAVRIQDFDFERIDSSDSVRALALARELIGTGTDVDAQLLWNALNAIARELRPRAGVITLEVLLDRCRNVTHLKQHPSYSGGWAWLEERTAEWVEDTRSEIGKGVVIDRTNLVSQLCSMVSSNRGTIVVGDSGTGKSALAKEAKHKLEELGPVYCVCASQLGRFAGETSLAHLLSAQAASWALLVIDSLEQCSTDEDFRVVARSVRSLRLDTRSSPWRVALVCQRGHWDSRVREALESKNVSLTIRSTIVVDAFTPDEVESVAKKSAGLQTLQRRPDLSSVLNSPKVLDVLARNAERLNVETVAAWVGESSIIEWFWTGCMPEPDGTGRRSRLLRTLAAQQADERRFATLDTDIDGTEAEALRDVIGAGLLRNRHGALSFTHDLYADYARQRQLLAEYTARRVGDLRPRLENPLWHKAVRLIALHILETSSSVIDGWTELSRAFGDSPIGIDLGLEAIVFAARPTEILEGLLPVLTLADATLLRRFLARFFYVATTPHPGIANVLPPGASASSKAALQERFRVPSQGPWRAIVGWIIQNGELVSKHAPKELIQIAESWLGLSKSVIGLHRLPSARELGAVVLGVAEQMAAERRYSRDEESRQKAFLVAIMVASLHADRFPHSRTTAGRTCSLRACDSGRIRDT